ncbi:hypothetical protein MKY09_05215 [Psychrobacillus sp. FSL K6-4046]
MKKDGKLNLPTSKRITKITSPSRLSKRNKELLAKIEQWKKQFG